MEVKLKSTSLVVRVVTPRGEVEARVWEGVTATGIPVSCLMERIATDQIQCVDQFERELRLAKHNEPGKLSIEAFT